MSREYPHQHHKREIGFDVETYKHSHLLLASFYYKATLCDWTHSEIEELRDFLHGKLFPVQISILKFYCFIPIAD